MNKYLIIYGEDNSFFYTTTQTYMTAVFEFMKYTGEYLSPIKEKAIKSMVMLSDIIELLNYFVSSHHEIKEIYKIERKIYPEEREVITNEQSD